MTNSYMSQFYGVGMSPQRVLYQYQQPQGVQYVNSYGYNNSSMNQQMAYPQMMQNPSNMMMGVDPRYASISPRVNLVSNSAIYNDALF